MDQSLPFFALGDPHFFDVPWAAAQEGADLLPGSWPKGWTAEQRVDGLWRYFFPEPDRELPEAGWKVHVSAVPQNARPTIEAVSEICRQEGVAWKCIRSARLVVAVQSKHAPPALVGKLCVVYPRDEEQLVAVVERLAKALAGLPGPRIAGDHHHASAPVAVRWGAFSPAWTEEAAGRMLPAVREQGRTVPDRRGRLSDRPLPPALARALSGSPATALPIRALPIRTGQLVRRHSAGALYRAVLEDGRQVALKEARHHAGIDHDGTDAVRRLRHEYTVLRHLSGQTLAPEPLDYWELEHSDILVMEWIDGDTLARRVARAHPRSRPGSTEHQVQDYAAWGARLAEELSEVVGRLHSLGVAHGDLQPTNVVLAAAGVRLVDFECAALEGVAVTTTTGTPGFFLDDPDPYARDIFALARTQACVVDPDVPLLDQRPDLVPHFGMDVTGHLRGSTAEAPMFLGSIESLVEMLGKDVRRRASPWRSDRLFPGGADQFRSPLGAHNLLSGAAGVLLALQATGHGPDPAHLDWLADLPAGPVGEVHGLGAGTEGVALALALLGRPEQAEAVVDRATPPLPREVSWARGQAGCAVGLIELGQLLGRDDLVHRGLGAYEGVRTAVADETFTVAGFGLLEGWSGVALAALTVGQLLPELTLEAEEVARAALGRERSALVPAGDTLVTLSAGRINTTLGRGTAGFVLAVARLPDPGPELLAAARMAAAGCAGVVPPVTGLLDGLAGSVAALRALGGHDRTVGRLEDRASWHCVPTPRGWSILGEQRLRCSDDLGTGSAGLLAALGADGPARLAHVLRLPRCARCQGGTDDRCHPLLCTLTLSGPERPGAASRTATPVANLTLTPSSKET